MFKPTVLLTATLLCAPAFAQNEQTLPARTFLTQIFTEMKVPFAIGPGIDGDITLATSIIGKDIPNRIQILLSTLPYTVDYRVESGVHMVRRKADSAPTTVSPAVNAVPANVSVAPPRITLNPTTVLNYRDALQWELTRTEIERERLLSKTHEISRDEVAANERTMQLLKRRLAELDSSRSPVKTTRTTPTVSQASPAASYADTVRLELFYAELEMARLRSQFNSGHPEVRTKQQVLEFLKRRVAELDGKTTQPIRKTAKR